MHGCFLFWDLNIFSSHVHNEFSSFRAYLDSPAVQALVVVGTHPSSVVL